jgi:chemotaxis signal transduction protein
MTPMTDHAVSPDDRSELELLSFRVGEQEYSVDIM